MSPLTKTFSVIVMVLAILLVALVVQFVYSTDNLKGQLQASQQSLHVANASATMAQQEISAIRAKNDQLTHEYDSTIHEKTAANTQLRQQLQTARAQTLKAKSDTASMKAAYTQLAASSKQYAQLLTQTSSDLKSSQSKVVDQAKKMIDLASHNQALQASLDSLNRQVRRFTENLHQAQEQVQHYKTMIAKLPEKTQQQIAGGLKAQPVVTYASVPIAGQITNIDHAAKDLTLAQVNVGSQDNVKPNMQFMVYRGDKFLGFLVIQQVDADAAVGRVEAPQGAIKAGDRILVPARNS